MPKYKPSLLFSDCYASVGNITFFHIDGECYFKTKANPVFPGTAGQQVQLSIHQRGIYEWKNLDHNEQLEWNALAKHIGRRAPRHAHRLLRRCRADCRTITQVSGLKELKVEDWTLGVMFTNGGIVNLQSVIVVTNLQFPISHMTCSNSSST